MEHSDRGRLVTELVSVWIANDGEHIESARYCIREGGMAHPQDSMLANHLTRVLRRAPLWSAAWQTAQELAPNDYSRVDWASIARDLIGE